MIFFTSDTHFGSERTLKFSCRPFANTKEMDETIINNWNKVIKKDDIVYHLGDFGNYEMTKKLNGKITLILGNYEQNDLKINFNGDFSAFSAYLKKFGFNDVIEKNLILPLPNENPLFLTHEPLNCSTKYFNLFGHVHEKCKCKRFGLNVGTDCFNFKPATLAEVEFYKDAILNHYDENVFVEELE